jgi:CHRD domain
MVRKRYLWLLALPVLALIVGGAYAAGLGAQHHVKGDRLTGFQEPPAVYSNGTGSFRAKIDDDAQKITFEERYSGLSAPATASHIHFGNRFTSGGVVAWLCGGGGKPACPAGTTSEATVTGTITPADVLAQQGIPAGGFSQFVRAIRAGVTYVNVHTATFSAGEIRAQINDRRQRQEH